MKILFSLFTIIFSVLATNAQDSTEYASSFGIDKSGLISFYTKRSSLSDSLFLSDSLSRTGDSIYKELPQLVIILDSLTLTVTPEISYRSYNYLHKKVLTLRANGNLQLKDSTIKDVSRIIELLINNFQYRHTCLLRLTELRNEYLEQTFNLEQNYLHELEFVDRVFLVDLFNNDTINYSPTFQMNDTILSLRGNPQDFPSIARELSTAQLTEIKKRFSDPVERLSTYTYDCFIVNKKLILADEDLNYLGEIDLVTHCPYGYEIFINKTGFRESGMFFKELENWL